MTVASNPRNQQDCRVSQLHETFTCLFLSPWNSFLILSYVAGGILFLDQLRLPLVTGLS